MSVFKAIISRTQNHYGAFVLRTHFRPFCDFSLFRATPANKGSRLPRPTDTPCIPFTDEERNDSGRDWKHVVTFLRSLRTEKRSESESGEKAIDGVRNEPEKGLRNVKSVLRNLKTAKSFGSKFLSQVKPGEKTICVERNEAKRESRYSESVLLNLKTVKLFGSDFADRIESGEERSTELPRDVKFLVRHLYDGGYLHEAGFSTKRNDDHADNGLDFRLFNDDFGRRSIAIASEKFGKDNQKIAKWLSGNHVKIVLLLGCPSLEWKIVSAAKRLRKFFRVQEQTVCSKCALNQSCKFVNRKLHKTVTKKLILSDVMIVITQYALEFLPPQLHVSDYIKASISRSINEVIKLSQTTSQSKKALSHSGKSGAKCIISSRCPN